MQQFGGVGQVGVVFDQFALHRVSLGKYFVGGSNEGKGAVLQDFQAVLVVFPPGLLQRFQQDVSLLLDGFGTIYQLVNGFHLGQVVQTSGNLQIPPLLDISLDM